MPRMTCVVSPELRDKLYEIGSDRTSGLSILYDTPHGDGLHYLDLMHAHAPAELHACHVDVILDGQGLRFKRDQDV